MIKIFKIKHEGFHRLGVLNGIIFIFFSAWLTEGALDGSFADLNLKNLFYWQGRLWEDSFNEGNIIMLLPILVYVIWYTVGYLILGFFRWVIEGFKK